MIKNEETKNGETKTGETKNGETKQGEGVDRKLFFIEELVIILLNAILYLD